MRGNKVIEGGKIPQHIAIIMDGNGRWAKQRLMSRSAGHEQGAERMIGLVQHAFKLGAKHITLYALSTENLKRPQEELDGLFELFRGYFNKYKTRVHENDEKIRFRALGDISLLPQDIRDILQEAEEKTAEFGDKSVNVAVCYGARGEIVRAVNEAVAKGELVSEESFKKFLYTKDIPDPDLIIRTGKETRLSNFLLYQAAYAELYFSKKMFPEFSDRDLERAFQEYAKRTRRFGKTDEQVKDQIRSYKNPEPKLL